jgi:hypothetical protein
MPYLASILVAIALGAIAALHVYWAAGGRWPGHDDASLADAVIGPTRMPGPAACLAVAVLLLVAAALVVGAAAVPAPPLAVRIGAAGVAAVFALRAGYGFLEARLRPSIRGSRYATLNRRYYSPLCLVLAALAAAALIP